MVRPSQSGFFSKLTEYLEKRYTYGSVQRYVFAAQQFINLNGYDAFFETDVHNLYRYFGYLRAKGYDKNYIHTEFYGLRAAFDFINYQHWRDDNPAGKIIFRDHRQDDIPFERLFNDEELKQILDIKSRYVLLQQRDIAILSLYIYQGLTTGEIAGLMLTDIDLKRSIVMVLGDRGVARTLRLKEIQVSVISRYLHFDRPFLNGENCQHVFLNKSGFPESIDSLHHLVSRLRNKFPGRKLNPKTIRQSVIVNWIRSGIDIVEVQIMAGHRHLSSTMRYIPPDTEGLRREMEKYWK